jgi:cytosine/adenosine deaminase-related metal-dependent hydrolase
MHVAESSAEFEMYMYRHGPLFDWLKDQRDHSDCGHGSPVQALARQGLLASNCLAVHVNYLWEGDARLLGDTGTHVVHCPRSHDYFGHRRFPRRELASAGVNICLGTDSLASTKWKRSQPIELDLFAEMRALAATSSDLSPAEIVRMATLNGAHALGFAGQIGEITAGARADMIAIPSKHDLSDPYDTVLHHTGPVLASMINGRWLSV